MLQTPTKNAALREMQVASQPGAPEDGFPEVVLARGLLPRICQYINGFLRNHGEIVETGGMLAGRYDTRGRRPVFRINGLIEAGPKAEFCSDSILFDHEYQSRILAAIRLQHGQAGNMGCFHVHPQQMDECSAGDRLADEAAVRDSDSRALVFGIITLYNRRPDPASLFYGNLKFDFFVMAEQTRFEYVHVRPILADLEVLEPAPALARLCLSRGTRIAKDWAALRRIGTVEKFTVRKLSSPGRNTVVLAAHLPRSKRVIYLLVRESGGMKVVLASQGVGLRDIHGLWELPEFGSQLWLSHLFLLVFALLAGVNSAIRFAAHCSSRYVGLLGDKRRLVAEVRAMEERYGARAVLRCHGENLYWEYTVSESGRHFPIEIRYPRRYPFEAPRIFSVLPLPSSPHQLVNDELCWINRSSGEWNPARDTAATCVTAAHRWFACLLVYLTLGQWPEEANDVPLHPV